MSYDTVIHHHSMVFDEHRNALYRTAIEESVTPESIVLDLGAGLGLHGLLAAQAGAKKVYMVEPTGVINLAKIVAQQNKLTNNIEFIQSTIEEANIAEPIDIIISVLTGNFLLTEDLLPSLFYARDKLLAPEGKLIPDCARMEVVPVSAAEYYDKHINCWSSPAQGIDYSAVTQFAMNNIYYGNKKLFECEYLAISEQLMALDFTTADKAECHETIKIRITKDGICHGLIGWFQARVGDEWLSTAPNEKDTHWGQAFLPLDPPIKVEEGQLLTFDLNRPEHGEWTWSVKTGSQHQRHSTFMSQPLLPSDMQIKSIEHMATLNNNGEMALHVLNLFNGNKSTYSIAASLLTAYPNAFSGQQLAELFVIDLVKRYS